MNRVSSKTKKLSNSLKKLDTDWWDEISDGEKASIERGLKDAKTGRVVEHDKVKKIYQKWLN